MTIHVIRHLYSITLLILGTALTTDEERRNVFSRNSNTFLNIRIEVKLFFIPNTRLIKELMEKNDRIETIL